MTHPSYLHSAHMVARLRERLTHAERDLAVADEAEALRRLRCVVVSVGISGDGVSSDDIRAIASAAAQFADATEDARNARNACMRLGPTPSIQDLITQRITDSGGVESLLPGDDVLVAASGEVIDG